jgi:hypothetical protein
MICEYTIYCIVYSFIFRIFVRETNGLEGVRLKTNRTVHRTLHTQLITDGHLTNRTTFAARVKYIIRGKEKIFRKVSGVTIKNFLNC